ncbi:MAG TPA: hypothetical protein VEC60_05845 [Reyranella sp.]|nr:hypothetical protein [Reyranella sp.]
MRRFLSTVAAIAVAASAAHADPGGGKGGGQGKGGGGEKQAQADHGGGKGNAGGKDIRGNSAKAETRDQGQAQVREQRGGGNDKVREARGNSGRGGGEVKSNRGRGGDDDRVREARGRGDDVRIVRDDRDLRVVRDDRGRFDLDDLIPVRSRGLIDGCPPGLAKKGTGCLPPGQFRKVAGSAAFLSRPDWWDFDDDRWFEGMSWDGRYRYIDGYLVRYDDDGIDGWLPLLGGALAPGNVWPSMYAPVSLPAYYQDYYGLGPVGGYRYYDDALYRVDPDSLAITSIAGLLTGDPFAVGQPLPLGYDVYNVPYSYRDRYVDGPDAYYRYSDGYVYQVDPTTQLITAAIQLLT